MYVCLLFTVFHERSVRSSTSCAIMFSWSGPELFRLLLGPPSFASDFHLCCLAVHESPTDKRHIVYVESSSLLLHSIKLLVGWLVGF